MSKEKKIMFMSIFISLVIIFGVSFAFFYYQRVSTKKVTLIAGEIYLHLNDGTDSITLTNCFPETKTEARSRNDNQITFTIDGKNTTTNKDIWYEIDLVEGDSVTGKTRIDPRYLKFDLIEVINNVETVIVDGKSFSDLDSRKIHIDSVDRNTTSEIVRTYKLRVWFSDSIIISDSEYNKTHTTTEWANIYGSVKVKVVGDFNERVLNPTLTMEDMCPGCVYMFPNNYEIIYTTWNLAGHLFFIGDPEEHLTPETPTVLSSSRYKEDYHDVITQTGKKFFLGLKLNASNQVTNAYTCGVYGDQPFCVEGWNDDSKFSHNQEILENIFGIYDTETDEGCRKRNYVNRDAISCQGGTTDIIYGFIESDGMAGSQAGNNACNVQPDGQVHCF